MSAKDSPAAKQRQGLIPLSFWPSSVTGQGIFKINPEVPACDAQNTALTLLSYIRDRVDLAVQGANNKDLGDCTLSHDEAYVLGFVLHAVTALVEALPVSGQQPNG